MIGRICIVLGTLYCLNSATSAPEGQPIHIPPPPNPFAGLTGAICTDDAALCGILARQITHHVIEEGKNAVTARFSALSAPKSGSTYQALPPLLHAPLPPKRIYALDREALKQIILRAM